MPAPVPTGIDWSEVTAAIATIAAVASAIFAVGALRHSKASAEAAQKSANAAQRANDLMARQLELAVEEQNRKLHKERRESEPLFNWRGGAYSPAAGTLEREFQNLGAMVTEVKIQTDDQRISASVTPNAILNNAQGKIMFTFERMIEKDLKPPINFTVSCVTKLGEPWVKAYQFIRIPGEIVEV